MVHKAHRRREEKTRVMKTGILYKEADKWWIKYLVENVDVSSSGTPMLASFWVTITLHPDDVAEFNELELSFDSLEARVAANPDVTFEIIYELPPNGNPHEPICYAKLIKNEKNLI